MVTADAWRRFGRWRHSRPFWGGLLLVLAGLTLFLSANLTPADLTVHFGQEGFLSYLLPVLLLLCGTLIWVSPAQRLFYAVIGLVTALYSLIGLNLGGFGAGMILGIVGGALAIAWTPAPSSGGNAEPPAEILADPRSDGDVRGKLLIITLVPLVVTAGMLAAGHPAPAIAGADCPKGMPSRSVPATRPAHTKASAPIRPAPIRPAPIRPAPTQPPASTPAPFPSDPGNPVVNGWNDFRKNFGEPSVSPSGSAAPASPPRPAPPSPSATRTPAPSPSTGLPDVPCLGPRVYKVAGPDDTPPVSADGSLLEGDSLTMYDSTYDGVVDLRTATGTIKALKFSMRKSVTTTFSLTTPARGGRTTTIKSDTLTTEGNVRFYTPKFTGKLYGVIPVTFTPDEPPPLTLPVLSFTDVRIQLAFVRCDTLTADPLDLSARA